MTPYYEQSGITIIHGNCVEVLESIKCDVVVTSPPYNTLPKSSKVSGLHAERRTGVNQWMERASQGYQDSMPETEYQVWLASIIELCMKACCGLVWVNHKVRYRDGVLIHPVRFLPFPIYAEVIWNRGGSMALNCKRYSPSHEGWWAFGKPHVWNDGLNKSMSVWSIAPDSENNDHPCAFPLEIPRRLVFSSSNPNDLIVDPFCGSGTTLRAAKDLNRRALGIEMEERYCEIAALRCQQEVLPLLGS